MKQETFEAKSKSRELKCIVETNDQKLTIVIMDHRSTDYTSIKYIISRYPGYFRTFYIQKVYNLQDGKWKFVKGKFRKQFYTNDYYDLYETFDTVLYRSQIAKEWIIETIEGYYGYYGVHSVGSYDNLVKFLVTNLPIIKKLSVIGKKQLMRIRVKSRNPIDMIMKYIGIPDNYLRSYRNHYKENFTFQETLNTLIRIRNAGMKLDFKSLRRILTRYTVNTGRYYGLVYDHLVNMKRYFKLTGIVLDFPKLSDFDYEHHRLAKEVARLEDESRKGVKLVYSGLPNQIAGWEVVPLCTSEEYI
ncbi:hypothetical protein J7M00_04745, partial [bacterium]|nr:hypothetical protein [bacterium]